MWSNFKNKVMLALMARGLWWNRCAVCEKRVRREIVEEQDGHRVFGCMTCWDKGWY